MQDAETTKVVILTRSFRVQGLIALLPGARLTDFLTDSKAFIAVTDADLAVRGAFVFDEEVEISGFPTDGLCLEESITEVFAQLFFDERIRDRFER